MVVRHPLLSVLLAVTLAGCATSPQADAQGSPNSGLSDVRAPERQADDRTSRAGAESQEADPSVATERVRVYSSRGVIAGASPLDPITDRPVVEGAPVRQDSFYAPPGTVALEISVDLLIGALSGGVEVRNEAGILVSYDRFVLAEAEGPAGSGCLACDMWRAPTEAPGKYTVSYYIAGAGDLLVHADALIENPE